jgi:N-acetyl-anhydromuramyl-L-alanine amidase AmpD
MRNFVLLVALLFACGCGPSPGRRQPAYQAWRPNLQPPLMIAQPPAIVQNPWKPEKKARDWRHIVLHHTASSTGSVASIHEAHLGRGWDGIGYHFLIGNGNGMENGVIEPTYRWREQMHGAHAGKDEYNQHGIGICLVGNFNETHPTPAQLAAVKRLVGVLKSEYDITSEHVIAHKDVKATACPGKNFPLAEVGQTHVIPTLVQYPTIPVVVGQTQNQRRQWPDTPTGDTILTVQDESPEPAQRIARVIKAERRQ